MAQTFWKLQYNINYQSEPDELTGGSDYGFGEKVYFDPALTAASAAATSRNILAARASMLGKNCEIVKYHLSRGDQARSRYDIGSYATLPVVMAQDVAVAANRQINEVDDSLLFRFQTDAGRRWTRQIRAIRDRWVRDQAFFASGSLVGPGVGGLTPFAPIQVVPDLVTAIEAVFSVTNTNGVLSAGVIVSGGTYPRAANGTYPLVITDNDGLGSGATGTFTIAVNTVTAVSVTFGGSNYGDPVLSAPARMNVNGLANYQNEAVYIANFISAFSQNVINFHPAKLADSSFPSGFQTIIDQNPPYNGSFYLAGTTCIERVSNRQSGRIWVKKKARHKVGI